MNPGDQVRILPFKVIRSRRERTNFGMVDDEFYSDGLLFASAMGPYCDKCYTLAEPKEKGYGTIYRLKEITWWWHEKWLIPLVSDFLSDKDFEI